MTPVVMYVVLGSAPKIGRSPNVIEDHPGPQTTLILPSTIDGSPGSPRDLRPHWRYPSLDPRETSTSSQHVFKVGTFVRGYSFQEDSEPSSLDDCKFHEDSTPNSCLFRLPHSTHTGNLPPRGPLESHPCLGDPVAKECPPNHLVDTVSGLRHG